MKATITLLLVLFTSIATFGQKIDLVNAPINPIALEYKKEHFNLKGDVYGYGYRVFSKEGMLIYEYGISRGLHYLYKNGFPYADTEGKLYEFNSEGYLSKKTYASLGVQTQTYTYNPKGLLTKVINTKGYNATYEYDDKGRLSKSNVGGNIREFSYQKSGEQLLVTVKDLSKTPAVVTKHIYKNGVEIGRNDKLFDLKYDNHGNKSGYDNAIYYSDIENRNNEISVVYAKSTYSIDPLTDCKFYINGQKADFLYKQIASIQSKDIFIYNPFTEKYYIVENAIDDTKSGQKQVFSKVFINSPYYLLNRKSASLSLGYKGAELANTANGMRDGALKVYNTPVYVAYDRTLNQTFYGELDNTNTSGYYPLQQISPNDNVVYLKAGENQFTVVIEGKVNAKENPNHKLYNSTDGGSILIDDKNKPLYYLPGTATATINKLYAGRKYNPATDKIQSANNKSTTTTTKSASATHTAGQTTETRYFNGKYSKSIVIDKVFFDYIKLKSKADGLSFTVLEEQFDFLSGIWTLKNSQGDIRIGIDYLVGDEALTIKIKYLTVGSQAIVKNDKDEGAKKMYNAAVEGFVKDLFKYLKIENNTTPSNSIATKSTTINNATSNTNTIAEKPEASYNPQLPLHVKEVSNNVFYFYQNNKRIQDPIFHQTTSMHKNKGVHCYYKADKDYYFYVPGTENPNAEGKYKMYGLRGRYLYTNISNKEQKFVFEGKLLQPQEYDLIVSRKKDCLLLLKENGLMFEIPYYAFPKQNETVTHTASNSDALGSNSSLFIVFKENGEMVVAEKGKVQPKANWKIINEDDKNFLINNVDGRKYRVGIYNLTATGIIAPNAINLVK